MDSWEQKTIELEEDDVIELDYDDDLRVEQWFAEGELLGLLYE